MEIKKNIISILNYNNNNKVSFDNYIFISNLKKYIHLYYEKSTKKNIEVEIPNFLVNLDIKLNFKDKYKTIFDEDNYYIKIIYPLDNNNNKYIAYVTINDTTILKKNILRSNVCKYMSYTFLFTFFISLNFYYILYKDIN